MYTYTSRYLPSPVPTDQIEIYPEALVDILLTDLQGVCAP